MTTTAAKAETIHPAEEKFAEGRDYYFENGYLVMTAHFLLKRGYCCGNGCRHCPYQDCEKNERQD